MTTHRSEKDSMGAIEVPADKLWGAQTQRSLEHFRISTEKMPGELIYALALTKCWPESTRRSSPWLSGRPAPAPKAI